jgi:hypothetical protein
LWIYGAFSRATTYGYIPCLDALQIGLPSSIYLISLFTLPLSAPHHSTNLTAFVRSDPNSASFILSSFITMHYADQPTPPFNSPYQHHNSRVDSLLDVPYPSPSRNDSVSKQPNGLGLYNCQPSFPLPPSPQPSEHWAGYVSTGASPLAAEAIADPYSSGAFDYPVSRSPLPWASTQISPRSSMSPPNRVMSVFSHMGSEHGCPPVKIESTEWPSVARYGSYCSPMNILPSSQQQQPLTVVPNRINDGSFQYNPGYGPPSMTRLVESTPMDYDNRDYEREDSKDSCGSSPSAASYGTATTSQERSRSRRHTDPASAPFRCEICPNKGFARRYNYTQHKMTHEINRKKENECPYPDCKKRFVRKTDLGRHERSVHIKDRSYRCKNCPSAFPRKDTLQRYV